MQIRVFFIDFFFDDTNLSGNLVLTKRDRLKHTAAVELHEWILFLTFKEDVYFPQLIPINFLKCQVWKYSARSRQ